MAMIYSNPAREQEPGALPDVEVFWAPNCNSGAWQCSMTHKCEHAGWRWQRVVLLSLGSVSVPDGEPVGPFDTEAEAIADAQCSDANCARHTENGGSMPHADAIDDTDELPPCVLAMRCYCAGHARGNPASEPCDTSETETLPDDDDGAQDDEPGDEDYFLSDDERSIMYLGKRIVGPVSQRGLARLLSPRDAVMVLLAEYVARDGYFPNVWKVSDHGNAMLISVQECGCYFTEHIGKPCDREVKAANAIADSVRRADGAK